MKNNKGFSLVELIVVIAIMAIMGGFIFLSFGVLTGQDARECANNLSTVLDKEKNYSLTKSGEADCYVEIENTADGYIVRYYAPQKAIGTATVLLEEENIGKESVLINGCYDNDFEDANPATIKEGLTNGKILRITYDRSSGAIKSVKLYLGPHVAEPVVAETDINVITIEKGRKYELCLYTATGKHTLERTD